MAVDALATVRKIQRRVIPLLMLCYFAAYLDRVNLSFAALSMNDDLGITPKVFGAGAGIFFIGYVIFELPSNLMLTRFGARRWFARIMLTWGLVSLLFAFVTGTASFLSLRFLLGVAEAGFFPGVMFFLTRWFPSEYRARMFGAFAVALPASAALGAPVSGLILGLDGFLHLRGWQWLFILEALPSLILGVIVLRTLVDSPSQAPWLDSSEREWLEGRLESEKNARAENASRNVGPLAALGNPRVWALGLIYCGIVAGNYGVSFFLPQIVRALGVSLTWVGILTALPFVAGALGMLWWGTRSDRRRERYWHLLIPTIVSVLALTIAALTDNSIVKLTALICAGFGAFANLPVFWTVPSIILTDDEAPAAIAVISSIGNVAGFAGPYAVGYFKQLTGSFASGLIALAVFICLTLVVAATFLLKRVHYSSSAMSVSAVGDQHG